MAASREFPLFHACKAFGWYAGEHGTVNVFDGSPPHLHTRKMIYLLHIAEQVGFRIDFEK
jgi:hypothetical protein